MNKIYGNAVGGSSASINPELINPDWNQSNPNAADYIKNKPELGSLASKDKVEKTDLSDELVSQIESGANVDLSAYSTTEEMNSAINTHNTSTAAHDDIRDLITNLTTKLNQFLDVDDTTADQLSEVLTLINNNKGTLESLTTSKVNVSDIVDNLTTSNASKVLSAKQGVAIKALIDALDAELDNKANTSALTSHINDTDVHVSTTDKTNWNNASVNATNALAEIEDLKNGSASLPGVDHAVSADKDGKNQNIASTYIKGLSANGKTVIYTKGDGTTGTFTTQDTVYTHPTYTAKSSGLYKITVDSTGHVSAATAVAKSDITDLGISSSDHTHSYLPLAGGTLTGALTVGEIKSNSTFTLSSSSTVYMGSGANTSFIFKKGDSNIARFDTSGHFRPEATATYNLGTSDYKWNNVYATNFKGNADTATKAAQDASGNVITSTYATKTAYNAHKHTFTGSEVTSKAASTTSGHTASIYSITGVGTLPSHSYTAPSLSGSVSNRCLTLTWSAGSHTFNEGTLPTRSSSAYTVSTSSHTHDVTAAGSLGTPT